MKELIKVSDDTEELLRGYLKWHAKLRFWLGLALILALGWFILLCAVHVAAAFN